MKNLEQFVRHVAPYVDIIGFSDDLGMHNGPQISAEMFREFFKLRYKRMYDYIKKHSPHLKICLHCCGSIHKLLPDLIEAGLDSFNPVQITCGNMEPWRLKKDFGDRMVFWGGGCDTREVLSRGTPAEVADNVRVNIEAFKQGGGFIFQQVHNILADVPPENIMAMFDAAQKYGKY
jgi:uroporphyrinogen decarboxylase